MILVKLFLQDFLTVREIRIMVFYSEQLLMYNLFFVSNLDRLFLVQLNILNAACFCNDVELCLHATLPLLKVYLHWNVHSTSLAESESQLTIGCLSLYYIKVIENFSTDSIVCCSRFFLWDA